MNIKDKKPRGRPCGRGIALFSLPLLLFLPPLHHKNVACIMSPHDTGWVPDSSGLGNEAVDSRESVWPREEFVCNINPRWHPFIGSCSEARGHHSGCHFWVWGLLPRSPSRVTVSSTPSEATAEEGEIFNWKRLPVNHSDWAETLDRFQSWVSVWVPHGAIQGATSPYFAVTFPILLWGVEDHAPSLGRESASL